MELKVKQFWDWFIDNEYQFREVTDTKTVVELLNNQVLEFGVFAWELGVGVEKPHSFTISPNGDKKRLFLSRQIFKQAPALQHWEFNYCRPVRKDWDLTFEVEDNQKIAILLKATNIVTIDFDDLPSIADLVVNNMLGEERRINDVHSIRFIDDFLPEDEKWIFPLIDLQEEFIAFHEEILEG